MEAPAQTGARTLSREDVKTLALSALGGALEFYDFIIFIFFAAVIGQLFFPPDIPEWLRSLQTFGLFATGYLARPLGGIVLAHFGDILGRKRMFALSIFLMAVPTLAMGLLPTYHQMGFWAPLILLILRILQGAAIGGEAPAAWVFVSEHARSHVGLACGAVTCGLTGGIFLGSLATMGIYAAFSEEAVFAYAWRIPFVAGGVFGLLAVYLRRWLSETPVFLEMQERKALAAELPLKAVLRDHRSAVLRTMGLTWVIAAAIVTFILMTPTLLRSHFFIDAQLAVFAATVAALFLTAGALFSGWLVDRLGARRVVKWGCIGVAAAGMAFFWALEKQTEHLVASYAFLGLLTGSIGAIPPLLVLAFPPAVRFSGLSFSYNVAYAIFGGITPILVTLLVGLHSLGPAAYVAVVCALGAWLASPGEREKVVVGGGEGSSAHGGR